METKLTLKLNVATIRRAKHYARRHPGSSLSRLAENYFDSLTVRQEQTGKKLPPIVAGLAGVARKSRGVDLKKDYTNYLIKKYR